MWTAVDPGLVRVNVCTEELSIVDVKIQNIAISRQTVITKDNVSVDIDSTLFYQITSQFG